ASASASCDMPRSFRSFRTFDPNNFSARDSMGLAFRLIEAYLAQEVCWLSPTIAPGEELTDVQHRDSDPPPLSRAEADVLHRRSRGSPRNSHARGEGPDRRVSVR